MWRGCTNRCGCDFLCNTPPPAFALRLFCANPDLGRDTRWLAHSGPAESPIGSWMLRGSLILHFSSYLQKEPALATLDLGLLTSRAVSEHTVCRHLYGSPRKPVPRGPSDLTCHEKQPADQSPADSPCDRGFHQLLHEMRHQISLESAL